MIVRWHYPAYMHFKHEDTVASFTCEADFLELPRIRKLMTDPDLFAQWRLSRTPLGENDLLLLIDKEDKQWVIGYLPQGHGLSFERWG